MFGASILTAQGALGKILYFTLIDNSHLIPSKFPYLFVCWLPWSGLNIKSLDAIFLFLYLGGWIGAAVSVNIKFTLVGNLSELKRCFSPLGSEESPAKRKQEVLPEEALDGCDTS